MSNLPFLKRKQTGIANEAIEYRKPDEEGEGHNDKEDRSDDGLEACARDLIEAVRSGDEKAVASAIKAAFELCDKEPHEEGPHTNEDEA